MGSIIATCDQLGIPLAKHKIEGPVTVIIFLGIEIDTEHMLLRLPTQPLTACLGVSHKKGDAVTHRATGQSSSRHQLDRLNESFRADLYLFLRRNIVTSANTVVLVSDASGTWGCGAFYGRSWLQCRWTHSWADIKQKSNSIRPNGLAHITWR